MANEKEKAENRETLKKALPSFMNKESPLDAANQDVPAWAIAIAALVVIGFVIYAIRTLSRTMSEENEIDAKQKKKRAERAAKKGKGAVVEDPEDGEDSQLLQWRDWLIGQLAGLVPDIAVVLLVALVITEGTRFMPHAQIVPCDTVLGNSPGGSCVTAPGLEEPLQCSTAMQSRPLSGAFPSLEQHAARACYVLLPKGILKPSSRYHWDSSGVTWQKQGWLASAFNRPWWNDRFVSLDKTGGAHVAIIPKSFEERITAFYTRYSPETLADTTKMANLVAKYNKNPDQATQGSFEAKTFSALHGKYNTGAMGSVVSPVTGGIDAAGALPGVYRYVGRQHNIYDRWAFFVTDVAPDFFYMFTTGDY